MSWVPHVYIDCGDRLCNINIKNGIKNSNVKNSQSVMRTCSRARTRPRGPDSADNPGRQPEQKSGRERPARVNTNARIQLHPGKTKFPFEKEKSIRRAWSEPVECGSRMRELAGLFCLACTRRRRRRRRLFGGCRLDSPTLRSPNSHLQAAVEMCGQRQKAGASKKRRLAHARKQAGKGVAFSPRPREKI